MMPGFDGVETLRRIREMNNGMYKDLPVIALTANTISGAREMFRSEGFTEFIPKPIERSVLERVLRRVLPEHCMIYDTDTSHAESLSENSENGDAISQIKEKVSEVKDVHPYTDTVPEDSNTEAEKPSRSYGSLVRAGINVGLGLDYCSGEEEFYLEMLQMFHDQEAEKRAELIALYEAANWKDYAIKVHALKSTSLTIGAEELSKQAKALEQAGKEENVAYIQENHPLLLQMYRKICECISGL